MTLKYFELTEVVMKRIALVCIMMVMAFSFSVQADTITLVSDPWMPYTGVEGSGDNGFMIEIALETLSAAGHTVVYKNVDWDTAIEEARKGAYNAIVGAAKGDAPDFVFPENSQGESVNHFFVMKDNPWKYNGIESLKGKKIGVLKSYSYGDALDEYFKGNPNVTTEEQLIKLLELMSEGKVDIIIENYYVFMLQCMKAYMLKEIADAGSDGIKDPVFIAFSPADSKSAEYAKIVSDGTEKLRQSGVLATIMDRYGLKDWK